METAPLKSFATKARIDLLKEVGARVLVVLAENSLARVESAGAVRELEEAIARDGRDQVVDRVAYTWFNRIIALRFMDANGYTASGVVSSGLGRTSGQPEVFAEAKAGTFDDAVVSAKTQEVITSLLNGTRPSQDAQGEAYGLLLEAYCRNWHKAMPFMFEREGDYTELLMPTALLAVDSVRDRAVKTLTEDVCREVEVIGWLYQFYISDRKSEVAAAFDAGMKAGAAEIPAATQLFTPHWIVRYLMENSLGRLWLLNNPSSRLAEQMDYYIKPVDEETEFLRISRPEELKVIDPAVGSGHMLTYAFDLLHAIYTEKGYDPVDIPGLILKHNLYGTEIDPRAGALAAFALTMKATAKRKLFLKNPVQPNVRVLENVSFDPDELDYLWSLTKGNGIARGDADEFWNAFEYADTLGSLIQPKEDLIAPLRAAVEGVSADGDLLHASMLVKAAVVVEQAAYLSQRYAVVVANPPYLGSGKFDAVLASFSQRMYPESKLDTYAMFMNLYAGRVLQSGYLAMVAMEGWMFLGGFEKHRRGLLLQGDIVQLAHLDNGIMGIAFVTAAFVWQQGSFRRRGEFFFVKGKDMFRNSPISVPVPGPRHSVVSSSAFLAVPGVPLAYWVSPLALELFNGPSLKTLGSPSIGIQSGDNARHYRFWYEVPRGSIKEDFRNWDDFYSSGYDGWVPLEFGGDRRRWAGGSLHVARLGARGTTVLESKNASLRNARRYFRQALVWNRLSQGRFYPRLVRSGHVFDDLSPFIPVDDVSKAQFLLGLLGSSTYRELLSLVSSGRKTEVGHVSALPALEVDEVARDHIDRLVAELVDIASKDWDSNEVSMDFRSPLQPGKEGGSLGAATALLVSEVDRQIQRAEALQEELNRVVSSASGPGDLSGGVVRLNADEVTLRFSSQDESPVKELGQDLVSFAVGCMFGRYSLDKPGLILADQGSTLQDYLAQVPDPSFIPDKDNVIPIVDGDWFEDDIVARFRQFLRAAFGDEHFEENLRFATESLGVKDIRDYFVKSFYDDHVKRYKKRPIYWLFRSPKGSFSALVYLHRYSPSTVSTVLTGYLREFIGKLEANLEHQERVAAGLGGASARDIASAQKEADRIRKVLVELRDYEHDILFPLAGQQIALDLDDGVLVNYQKLGAALKDIGLKKGGNSE